MLSFIEPCAERLDAAEILAVQVAAWSVVVLIVIAHLDALARRRK